MKGLKARRIIAQGKRSETSAALGRRIKRVQALKGRKKVLRKWMERWTVFVVPHLL